MVCVVTNLVSKAILDLVDTKLVSRMKKVTKDRVQRTLTLPENIDEQLRAESYKLRTPISYLVEKAVIAYFKEEDQQTLKLNSN
jgi:transcription initiation factor IIE alpha subunit